jgi:hypothetical protein
MDGRNDIHCQLARGGGGNLFVDGPRQACAALAEPARGGPAA